MTSQSIGSFVIVVDKSNNILLGERKNCYKSGFYGCPGGRLEGEESLKECATRELFEETGLQANSIEYLGVIRELQNGHNFIHFAFLCKNYNGNIALKEPEKCVNWDFYQQDNIPAKTLPAHVAGIRLLSGTETNFVDILK